MAPAGRLPVAPVATRIESIFIAGNRYKEPDLRGLICCSHQLSVGETAKPVTVNPFTFDSIIVEGQRCTLRHAYLNHALSGLVTSQVETPRWRRQ